MRLDSKNREINDLVCDSHEFSNELMKYFNWFTGVADSVIKNTLAIISPFYFSTRENHAVGMAFGAHLNGKKPCVLIQNSGIGLALDSLYGLFSQYNKGLVLIISNRGELDWEEIQHKEWGATTLNILAASNIKVIDFQEYGVYAIQKAHDAAYLDNQIVAIILHRGNLDE
jgi:sulfopyruvate decarboxylase subunit alpha